MTSGSSGVDWRSVLAQGPPHVEAVFRAIVKLVDDDRSSDLPPRQLYFSRALVRTQLETDKKKALFTDGEWRGITEFLVGSELVRHVTAPEERSKAGGKPTVLELLADILDDAKLKRSIRHAVEQWGTEAVCEYAMLLDDDYVPVLDSEVIQLPGGKPLEVTRRRFVFKLPTPEP